MIENEIKEDIYDLSASDSCPSEDELEEEILEEKRVLRKKSCEIK
jgi:hypothetical protein